MAHFENGRPYGRWEADFPQIWEAQYATQAETLYLEKALPGKLFVENSPPEIYLPHQLNATFSKHGKVDERGAGTRGPSNSRFYICAENNTREQAGSND